MKWHIFLAGIGVGVAIGFFIGALTMLAVQFKNWR